MASRPTSNSVTHGSPFLYVHGAPLMQYETQAAPVSRAAVWAGRILTAIPVLFLLFDGVAKVMKVAPVLEASAQLEVPERVVPGLGVVLIAATLIYAFPQTSVL